MRRIFQVDGRSVLPRIGWGLMIASATLWALLLVVPFLPIAGEQKLAAGGAILLIAEVVFWMGAALAGPEAARRMRAWWRAKPKDRSPPQSCRESDASDSADRRGDSASNAE